MQYFDDLEDVMMIMEEMKDSTIVIASRVRFEVFGSN